MFPKKASSSLGKQSIRFRAVEASGRIGETSAHDTGLYCNHDTS